jgi:hypothetical protein
VSIIITLPPGTDAATADLVRHSVDATIAACDAYWSANLQSTPQASATAVCDYYRGTPPAAANDGQRAAELALDVIRETLRSAIDPYVRHRPRRRGADRTGRDVDRWAPSGAGSWSHGGRTIVTTGR